MTGFNNQQIFGRSFFCQPPLRRLLTRGVLAPLRSLPAARLRGGVGFIFQMPVPATLLYYPNTFFIFPYTILKFLKIKKAISVTMSNLIKYWKVPMQCAIK